jgi:NitT/TauT family transport system permease protein
VTVTPLDDDAAEIIELPSWREQLWKHAIDYLPAVLSLVFLGLVWEAACRLLDIPEYLLPAPSTIWSTLVSAWPVLIFHTWVTLQETIYGFVAGTVLGLTLALLITYSPMLSKTLYTLIVASQVVPKIAIAPLLIIWFGYGMMPKVAVTALLAFFPVVIAAVTGLLAVSPDTINVLRSVAASRSQIFFKVMFPNSLPYLFSGLKIAITLSVVGALVGEWVGADSGLGYLIQIANSQIDTPLMFAAFAVLVVIGIGLFAIVALLEWVLMPWHQKVDVFVTM